MKETEKYTFEETPRIHIRTKLPPKCADRHEMIITYNSLPGIVERWVYNVDGWDIFDRVLE